MKVLSTLDLGARTGRGKGKETGIIVIRRCLFRTSVQQLSKSNSKHSRVTRQMINKRLKYRRTISMYPMKIKRNCLRAPRSKTRQLRPPKSKSIVVLKKQIVEVNEPQLHSSNLLVSNMQKVIEVVSSWVIAAALLLRILRASRHLPSSCQKLWRSPRRSSRVQNCKRNKAKVIASC